MKKILLLILYVFSFSFSVNAQFYFKKIDTLNVKIGNTNLENAWAGGANFVQVSDIDLDQDSIMDLFVFDRTGNKISTYINKGTADSIDYKYDWTYIKKFPKLHDWVLLRDYNCDGKMDIYTYNNGGVDVYRNISDANGLSFVLAESLLFSNYHPNMLNLYITLVDIPAIYDIDKDGDIDILTFNILGGFLEYHKNMSMEIYGVCDSLKKIYQLDNGCWGNFSESGINSTINLGISCKGPGGNIDPQQVNHSGSALCSFDADGDGDCDLLLHDISSNGGIMLTNGGDINTASLVAQDGNFPSNSVKLDIVGFPSSYYVDVNNDGKRDLIASPNAQNLSENFNSIWWYKNMGNDSMPVFVHQKNNFLQDEMIEVGQGAFPVFFDYNSDGLLDIVIGNAGYYNAGAMKSTLTLMKNIGTIAKPAFEIVSLDYANLSLNNFKDIYPTFGDLDGDTDKDMVVGDDQGHLHYYENMAAIGTAANFVLSMPLLGGIDIGSYAMPQLIDLDRDGLLDLAIGEQSGNVNYYRNTGTVNNAAFTLMKANLGGVKTNLPNYIVGYSAPKFIDVNGSFKLICGSENGNIYYYNNIDGNLNGNFTLVDSAYYGIWEGVRSALDITDLNQDGYYDMVVGNYSGGLGFYLGDFTVSIKENIISDVFNLYPNPAFDNFTIEVNKELDLSHTRLSIVNVVGEKVLEKSFTERHTATINISNLAKGFYFVNISSDTYSCTKKLVVAR